MFVYSFGRSMRAIVSIRFIRLYVLCLTCGFIDILASVPYEQINTRLSFSEQFLKRNIFRSLYFIVCISFSCSCIEVISVWIYYCIRYRYKWNYCYIKTLFLLNLIYYSKEGKEKWKILTANKDCLSLGEDFSRKFVCL